MKRPDSGIAVVAENKLGKLVIYAATASDDFWDALEEAQSVGIGVQSQEDLICAIYDVTEHLSDRYVSEEIISDVQAFIANAHLDKIRDIDDFENEAFNEGFNIEGDLNEGFKSTINGDMSYTFVSNEALDNQKEKSKKNNASYNSYGSMEP